MLLTWMAQFWCAELYFTEPEAVASFLAKQQITPERIVHESGQLSIWLQRGLVKLSLPVTCIDARRAHNTTERNA